MAKADLTAQRLREILHYDSESGAFRWIAKPARQVLLGALAGSVTNLGYLKIKIDGERYFAHRLAFLYMTDRWPASGMQVDHVDRDSLNNKWSNLREVTSRENMQNRGAYRNGTSGTPGVTLQDGKYFIASLGTGKGRYLGCFKTMEDAVRAREDAIRQRAL